MSYLRRRLEIEDLINSVLDRMDSYGESICDMSFDNYLGKITILVSTSFGKISNDYIPVEIIENWVKINSYDIIESRYSNLKKQFC